MDLAPLFRRLASGGLVRNSVLLTVLLVMATTLSVALVIVVATSRQIEQAADRRLQDAATFFQSTLKTNHDDLMAAAAWLARDRDLMTAVTERDPQRAQERLDLTMRVPTVDEMVVAARDGEVVAQARFGGQSGQHTNMGDKSGFDLALALRPSYGIDWQEGGLLRQFVYVAVASRGGAGPAGIVRAASFLDEKDLDLFREGTGLEASLFFGDALVATTLRQPDGSPITGTTADLAIYREVVGMGRKFHASSSLPIGQVRSYYLPLKGPDETRVGIVAITLPVKAIAGELADTLLPVLPVTVAVLMAGAMLAHLLARRVRGPVLSLAVAATRLSMGDLSTPIPAIKEKELSPVAEQLEQARHSLKTNLEAIASAEARQRALFATLREAILAVSPGGAVTDCNAASIALFGGSLQILGRPIQDLLPFLPLTPQDGDGEKSWQASFTDRTGQKLDIEVTRTRLPEGNLPGGDVYVIHDVSRYAEINRMREQLLYDLSHELRSPLAVLDNALEMLATEYGSLTAEEFDHLLLSARRVTRRLRAVMENLLSAGAIQSGRFVISCRPTEVRLVVEDALESVDAMVQTRGQTVEHYHNGSALYIMADQRYLSQALSNLLSNACKYGPDGQIIRVRATREDDRVRLTVEDQGPGIPAERQAELFNRFYRVNPGQGEFGFGLGLSIVKGIVEAHGGNIGLDSAPGKGTRIWLTIPAAERP